MDYDYWFQDITGDVNLHWKSSCKFLLIMKDYNRTYNEDYNCTYNGPVGEKFRYILL